MVDLLDATELSLIWTASDIDQASSRHQVYLASVVVAAVAVSGDSCEVQIQRPSERLSTQAILFSIFAKPIHPSNYSVVVCAMCVYCSQLSSVSDKSTSNNHG